MSPKFQVYKDSAEKIRFRVISNNNQVVAFGEACENHEVCLKGITEVQKNCNVALEDLTVEDCPVIPNPKFEVYTDVTGLFRFRLKDAEGRTIIQGEGCGSKEGCLDGVEVVKSCMNALVEDPFTTEVMLEVEIPKVPAISIKEASMTVTPPPPVVPTPAPEPAPIPVAAPQSTTPAVTIRLGDYPKPLPQALEMLPVVSMLTLLGFELVAGFTRGVFTAATTTREVAYRSNIVHVVTEKKGF
jgi:uncharacterized protein